MYAMREGISLSYETTLHSLGSVFRSLADQGGVYYGANFLRSAIFLIVRALLKHTLAIEYPVCICDVSL